MNILAKILRTLSKAGKWYMRRRGVVKLLIFFAFFILPIAIYAYIETTKELSKPIIYIGVPPASIPQIFSHYSSAQCSDFFRDKTLYVFGFFTVSDTCYIINESTYIYELYRHYALMKVYGNASSNIVYVIVLQKNVEFVLMNESIEVSQIVLAIFSDTLSPQLLRSVLDENALRDVFCSVAVPGSSWGANSVPMDTFVDVCSSR